MADNDNNNPAEAESDPPTVAAAAPPPTTDTAKPVADPLVATKLRNLKIKTGVVKRLTKDKVCYLKEAEDQEKKIEKFKEEGKEELFIRQQVGNLKETQMMIPDVGRTLQRAYDELTDLLKNDLTLADYEEYKQAVLILKEAEPQLVKNVFADLLESK